MTQGISKEDRSTPRVHSEPDEIRLSAGLYTRFSGHFSFTAQAGEPAEGPLLVDARATNSEHVLSGHSLSEFAMVPADSATIPALEDLPDERLDPKRMGVVLLAGGLSFRSAGRIHPLLPVPDPTSHGTRTLLRRQLDRIARSDLAAAKVFVAGTPLNRQAFEDELRLVPPDRRPTLYVGGLAPRLAAHQHRTGAPRLATDDHGAPSYNPLGHFEAVRWLVLGGAMADVVDLDLDVVVTVSYSNWGRVFSPEILRLARHAARRQDSDAAFLLLAEVEPCPRQGKTGSILAQRSDEASALRLVKYNYGCGNLSCSSDTILMSTNTLYFGVRNVLKRMAVAASRPSSGTRDLRKLLAQARVGPGRDEVLATFDAAFPVAPQLIATRTPDGEEFLRIERDLDQLTLIGGEPPLAAVRVGAERAVFIKLPEDLADPAKRAYLFES